MKRQTLHAAARTTQHFGRTLVRTAISRARGRALHPEWGLVLETLVRSLRDNDGLHNDDMIKARASMESLTLPSRVSLKVWRHEGVVGGVPGLWLRPNAHPPTGTLVWFHGGGYAMGSSRTHAAMAGRVALTARCDVFLPDYRLAPEHPAPAAGDDALAVIRGLYDRGVSPQTLALAGDSAGGGLTLCTLVRLREEGLPQPAAAALLSPWVDLGDRSGSVIDNGRYDWIQPEVDLAGQYAAGRDLRDPSISPLYADLRDLAPIYLEVGTAELLLDQARRLAKALQAVDADLILREWPHMVHVGYVFAPVLLEARARIDDIGAYLGERLAAAGSPP